MEETVRLNTGAEMPAIGFGTWHLAAGDEAYGATTEALKVGYRFVDTAALYGNEASVGRAIRESEVPREEIWLTTKVWNIDQGYERTIAAYEYSLARLGLDKVDLYLIHWPATEARRESWRAMEEMYREEKVRNIGVSNFSIDDLEDLRGQAHMVPAVNQIEFHPLNYHEQLPLINYCKDHGVIVEAYSPLSRGGVGEQRLFEKIGRKYDKSAAQVVLRWCIQHSTVPIPKSAQVAHIRENFAVFDFELDTDDMRDIDALTKVG
jgi:diketogulonate reductase-like aldo/keto reductase